MYNPKGDRLYVRYFELRDAIKAKGGKYLPLIDDPTTEDGLSLEVLNLNQWFYKWATNLPKHIERIPVDGHWYMITITQPSGESEFDIVQKHEKTMAYLERNKIAVYLAGLEKAGSWHVHYAVCSPVYLKNTKRDLQKLLGVPQIDVSKKVKTLKDFNGLCNYVLKRGYDSDGTHIRDLVTRLEYKDGIGWQKTILKESV